MAEMKAYAVAIGVNEFFGRGGIMDLSKANDIAKRMKSSRGFRGVHPTGEFMAMMYDTPEHAKAAFNRFYKAGYNVKIIANPAYIDTKYFI